MKVADPDPRTCAFLTLDLGSGIGFFRIPDPGNQTHIFDSWMTNFWVNSTIILSVLAKKNFFTFSKIKLFSILWSLWLQKIVGQTNFLPLLFWCCCWIRDPRSAIQGQGSAIQGQGSGIRDPGSEIRDPVSGTDKNQYPGSAINGSANLYETKIYLRLLICGKAAHTVRAREPLYSPSVIEVI